MANYEVTLNIVKSIMYHLNDVNFTSMARKMISLEFKTEELDNVAEMIHQKALSRLNYTKIYAQLCAYMIKNSLIADDQRVKFQKIILSKCYDTFYTYKIENIKRSRKKSNFDRPLANCSFIGELYNQGVLFTEDILSFMTDLLNEMNNLQIHCLCELVKLAGPKLSKTHSMTKFVGYLLLLKDEGSISQKFSSNIKLLIDDIKKMYFSQWIYEDPDKLVRERLYISNNSSLIKNSLTNCQLETYEYNMMAEYIFSECNNLLLNIDDGYSCKEIEYLLTPVLHLLIQHNQVSFIVSLCLAAIDKELNIRIFAGKLLANLCNSGLLSSYLVAIGFDKIINNYYDDEDMIGLLHEIQEEFKNQLTSVSGM